MAGLLISLMDLLPAHLRTATDESTHKVYFEEAHGKVNVALVAWSLPYCILVTFPLDANLCCKMLNLEGARPRWTD